MRSIHDPAMNASQNKATFVQVTSSTSSEPESGGADDLSMLAADTPPDDGPVAIFVCHGMGQQVPFETIDSVARSLRKGIKARHREQEVGIKVGFAKLSADEDVILPRAELSFSDEQGISREVHIYESYWAPVTEGKVGLRDVISFLLTAGLSGLKNSLQPYGRWCFGGWKEFDAPWLASLALLLALGVLLILIGLNAGVGLVVSKTILADTVLSWLAPNVITDFTIDLLILLADFCLLFVVYWVAGWRHRQHLAANEGWSLRNSWMRLWVVLCTFVVWLTIFLVIGLGVCVLWQGYWHYHLPEGSGLLWWQQWGELSLFVDLANHSVISKMIWLLFFAACWAVRGLLVQYPGDVAAYVSAHKASKFCDIRKEVSRISLHVASAIYGARREPGSEHPLYRHVVVVGHSLGSVVSYDTLNALILEDELRPAPSAAGRTHMLLTFGSPLDKTAYIFRSQQAYEAEVREGLAAAAQPLITNYRYRPARWVNLYSWHDWISGPLDYYTDPSSGLDARDVENVEDGYACIHVLAHTQYWASETFAKYLYEGVVGHST